MADKDLEFNCSRDLEVSKNGSEYFELIPKKINNKKTNKDKLKNSNIIKMLVLTTILVATVVTVIVNPFKEVVKILPEFIKQEVLNYTYDEQNYTGSYVLQFSFDTNGLEVDSIELFSKPIILFEYMDDVPLTIKKTYSKDELIVKDNDIITINYNYNDIYTNYETNFIINYKDVNKELVYTINNIKTGLSQFITYEVNNNNTLIYNDNEDSIDFVATFNDFIYGSFDFQIDSLYISTPNQEEIKNVYINDNLVEIMDGIIDPIAISNNEPIIVKFSTPKLMDGSNEIHVEIGGDSYYNNTKLDMSSFTFVNTEIIIGEAFKINKATINNSNISLNGMTIKNVEFNTYGNNYYNEIDKVVPGNMVYVRIKLEGSATKEFMPVFDIYVNETKIPTYEVFDLTIYEGDTEAYYEFYFEMPNSDILSSDIIINAVSEAT